MHTYEEYVDPYRHTFNLVEVSNYDLVRLKNSMERGFRVRGQNYCDPKARKRYFTGYLGELAVAKYLNEDIFDWRTSRARGYIHADLGKLGLDVGIKTVEYGYFPVIDTNIVRPEIINLKLSFNRVLVCGVALEGVMRYYNDKNLILSPVLRRRGTKTGFYGLHKLLPFNSVEDLLKIVGNNNYEGVF